MTPIRFLSRGDVASLLTVEDCIPALEDAFTRQAQGSDPPPAILGLHTALGGLHVKAAVLGLERPYLVAKANANFPGNRSRSGLPTIQGIIAIVDGEDGRFLALMDSIEVTVTRTAAATAIAAKHLARRDAATLTVCGCGVQGRAHVRALAHVLPLRRVRLLDADPAQAHRLAAELAGVPGLEVEPVTELAAAVRTSDVCVTCTPSRTPVLTRAALAPGLFVAGVGADSHDKHEIAPEVLSTAKLVVDHLEQCAAIGDLHHALAAGAMSRDAVHAELPDLVTGRRPGRETSGEITVFDSTGVATEDAAAALLVYRRALERDVGSLLDLDGEPNPGAGRPFDRRAACR
jgi:ornithine cyclodeaminase/alanine dehydrogenase-like protein (mu-crystallin family)